MLYWDVQNQGNESEGKVKWSMEEWEADSKWYFFSWTYFKDTGIHSSKDRLHRNAKPRILCLGEEWRGNFSPAFLLSPVLINQCSFHEELNASHFWAASPVSSGPFAYFKALQVWKRWEEPRTPGDSLKQSSCMDHKNSVFQEVSGQSMRPRVWEKIGWGDLRQHMRCLIQQP